MSFLCDASFILQKEAIREFFSILAKLKINGASSSRIEPFTAKEGKIELSSNN